MQDEKLCNLGQIKNLKIQSRLYKEFFFSNLHR